MKTDVKLTARQLLELELDSLWAKVYGGLGLSLRKEFDQWLIRENRPDRVNWNQWLPQQMCFFLVYFCDRTLDDVSELDTDDAAAVRSAVRRLPPTIAFAWPVSGSKRKTVDW